MAIKLKEQKCVVSQEEWQYKVEINGKEVWVSKWHSFSDNLFSSPEGDIEFLKGEKLLTEEEKEEVLDYIQENF